MAAEVLQDGVVEEAISEVLLKLRLQGDCKPFVCRHSIPG